MASWGVISCRTALAVLAACASPAMAKDFGTQGPVWEIAEPSILDVIKARLQAMEASGELLAMKGEMQDKTKAYVARPRPVVGLHKAREERLREIDLSIRLTRDLTDHQGRVFVRAGSEFNPLDYSRFGKRIVVFDGDDPDQVAFALAQGNELDTLLVLTNGAPLELMREHGRRFWFDQDGVIAAKFQLQFLPSEITRGDGVMLVREVPVSGARPDQKPGEETATARETEGLGE